MLTFQKKTYLLKKVYLRFITYFLLAVGRFNFKPMIKVLQLFFLLLTFSFALNAQNELYLEDGALLYLDGENTGGSVGSKSTIPTIYVDGEVVNNTNDVLGEGIQNSQGEIQLTGSWTNVSNGGLLSNGDEVFIGGVEQEISGDFVGDNSDFFNLIIEKTSNTIVRLLDNVESDKLIFGVGGYIITTDDASTEGFNGGAYLNELYVKNGAPTAVGAGSTTSSNLKVVEGKLRRNIAAASANGTEIYQFPIAVETSSQSDGPEFFELQNVSVNADINVLGYFGTGGSSLVGTVVYEDVGAYSKVPFDTDVLNTSNDDNLDGEPDQIAFNDEFPGEWYAIGSGAANYDIEVFPSSELENEVSFVMPDAYGLELKWLSKDGSPNNVALSAAPSPWGTPNWPSGPNGYVTGANGYKITGLTSFSEFKVGGVNSRSQVTILPVELISLTATAVDNEYVQLNWATASEINNEGFEIQRSLDGIHFERIGWIEGNGTTNELQSYTFDDKEVEAGKRYYYRLKQIDFGGVHEYSDIVDAILVLQGSALVVGNFIPNPAITESSIRLTSGANKQLRYQFFDVLGKVIEEGDIDLQVGEQYKVFMIQDLSSGEYFVTITDGKQQFNRKLVKR